MLLDILCPKYIGTYVRSDYLDQVVGVGNNVNLHLFEWRYAYFKLKACGQNRSQGRAAWMLVHVINRLDVKGFVVSEKNKP